MNIRAGLRDLKNAEGTRHRYLIGPKAEQKEFVTSEAKRAMLSL